MQKMKLQKQFQRFKESLARKLEEAGHILEGEMHNLVAIDTGKLNASIKTDKPIDRGNIISVDVGSSSQGFFTFYAPFVDLGIGRIFNYHRRKGASRPVVWVGNGMQYVERSLQNKLPEIRAKIREARI